jgi:hypothetical protein
MQAPCPNRPARISASGCLAAVLFGIAGLCGPTLAAAADAKGGHVGPILMHRAGPAAGPAAPTATRRVTVERRETRQTTQTGPVVLRGRPPDNTNASPIAAASGGASIGSSAAPPSAALPSDAGFDTSLDRSGLSPPGGVLRLGR